MVAHDLNHINTKPAGSPNFFMVVDLIERGLAARGIPASVHFHEGSGRFWMNFTIHPGTKDSVALTVRPLPLGPRDEIQNMKAEWISGPGSEPVVEAMREILSRFGGEWEERDYYTAAKIDLPEVEKSKAPKYEPSARIKAAVEIADAIGFDGMETFLNLLDDPAKSAAYARVIERYGAIGFRDIGPDPRAIHGDEPAARRAP